MHYLRSVLHKKLNMNVYFLFFVSTHIPKAPKKAII